MLSDSAISRYLENGELVQGFDWDNVQPASIDLRLKDDSMRFPSWKANQLFNPAREETVVDPLNPKTHTNGTRLQGWKHQIIKPKEFMLVSTQESVELPSDLAGRVEGKSSLARLGLLIHVTAGFIDPGFTGNITLELCNLSSSAIKLTKGMKICQISFMRMEGEVQVPYSASRNHYQGQSGTTASRYGK